MRAPWFVAAIVVVLGFVAPPSTAGSWTLLFADDFESGVPWGKFEEEVMPGCYTTNDAGSVEASSEAARGGSHGLAVGANTAGTAWSNHVIAQRLISDMPTHEDLLYRVRARLPSPHAEHTQSGPEFSVQSTRSLGLPSLLATSTVGFQYVASPYEAPAWHVWAETAPTRAAWIPIHEQALEPDTWYTFELRADLPGGTYRSIDVTAGPTTTHIDLTHLRIANELKWLAGNEGTWVSVEAENLWTNCGSTGDVAPGTVLHYDDVALYANG